MLIVLYHLGHGFCRLDACEVIPGNPPYNIQANGIPSGSLLKWTFLTMDNYAKDGGPEEI